MKTIISVVNRLNQFIFNVIAILFGLATLLTICQVFARYVLRSPLVGTEEIIRYSVIWIVLLGTAIALRKGLLVSVEIVLHIVPRKIKKIMEIIVIVLNIMFLFILTIYGFNLLEITSGQKVGALDLPVAVFYYSIPISGILGILNAFVVLVEKISNKQEEEDEPDGSTLI